MFDELEKELGNLVSAFDLQEMVKRLVKYLVEGAAVAGLPAVHEPGDRAVLGQAIDEARVRGWHLLIPHPLIRNLLVPHPLVRNLLLPHPLVRTQLVQTLLVKDPLIRNLLVCGLLV